VPQPTTLPHATNGITGKTRDTEREKERKKDGVRKLTIKSK
jgi:hypothetical protein